MEGRSLKIKISILILILFSLTSLIFGCIGDNDNSTKKTVIKQGFGVVGDSEFQLESGWSQKQGSVNNNESNFNFNETNSKNVIFMRVTQFNNKLKYDENLRVSGQLTSTWHVLSSANENIEGFDVRTIMISRVDDTETIKYYFFEKDGKYYKVLIDMISSKSESESYFEDKKNLVDSTIKKIIKTIH